MALAVFGSQLAPSVAGASSVPLPVSMAGVGAAVNGVAAPLYYVFPGQLNLQIPYETAVNGTATLQSTTTGRPLPKPSLSRLPRRASLQTILAPIARWTD
jgi:uncharacterized protein (TIGR03437 family)